MIGRGRGKFDTCESNFGSINDIKLEIDSNYSKAKTYGYKLKYDWSNI